MTITIHTILKNLMAVPLFRAIRTKIYRSKYNDYFLIAEYCSTTFPSLYIANPRRPLLRVIPPRDTTAVFEQSSYCC